MTAQHIPGIQNSVADTASRHIECRTEWTLDKGIFQSTCQRFLRTGSRPLCISPYSLSNQVCLEVPGSGGSGCGCISSGFGPMDLSNSSFCGPSSSNPKEGKVRSGNCSPDCTQLVGTTMVPRVNSNACGLASAASPPPSLLFLPFQPSSSSLVYQEPLRKQQAFQRESLTSCWRQGGLPPRGSTQAFGKHGFAGVLNGLPVPL